MIKERGKIVIKRFELSYPKISRMNFFHFWHKGALDNSLSYFIIKKGGPGLRFRDIHESSKNDQFQSLRERIHPY